MKRSALMLMTMMWMGGFPLALIGQSPCAATLTEDFSDTLFPKVNWIADGVSRVTTAGAFLSAPAAASFGTYNATLTLPAVAYPTEVNFALGRTTATTAKLMIVEVSTDDATTGFVPIDTFDHDNTVHNGFTLLTTNLSAYGNQPAVWIRFRKASSTTSPWRLDDVEVCNAVPLPVTLIHFSGEYNDSGGVSLQWITASEVQNAWFGVLRSSDGDSFLSLGIIPGAGTTDLPSTYYFYDSKPIIPLVYYQLMQTDFDGSVTYAPVICVQTSKKECSAMKISNLISGRDGVMVELQGAEGRHLRFSITDMMGNLLYDRAGPGVFFEKTDLFVKLSAGVYVLMVSDHHERITHKFSVDF